MSKKMPRLKTKSGFVEGVMLVDKPFGHWLREYDVTRLAIVQIPASGEMHERKELYLLREPNDWDKLYSYLQERGLSEETEVMLSKISLAGYMSSINEIVLHERQGNEQMRSVVDNFEELLNSPQFEELMEEKAQEMLESGQEMGFFKGEITKELMEKLDAAKRKPIEPSAN